MRVANPDPGALTVTKLKTQDAGIEFVNAFAANDPQSTQKTILMIKNNFRDKKIGIFLNISYGIGWDIVYNIYMYININTYNLGEMAITFIEALLHFKIGCTTL